VPPVSESSLVNASGVAYDSLASSLPTNSCGSYSHVADTGYATVAANHMSGPIDPSTWSKTSYGVPYKIICGDLTLNANTEIDSPAGGALIVVENGGVYLNGYTLNEPPADGGLTVAFSGTPNDTNLHSFEGTGGSTIDFSSPPSGTWEGVGIYYDPSLGDQSGSSDINYSGGGTGNGWNMDITGLVYDPLGTFNITGSINHATGGVACFGAVTALVSVSGKGSIFSAPGSQCVQAGLQLPTTSTFVRTTLVQ
jgi:hypothetical protein